MGKIEFFNDFVEFDDNSRNFFPKNYQEKKIFLGEIKPERYSRSRNHHNYKLQFITIQWTFWYCLSKKLSVVKLSQKILYSTRIRTKKGWLRILEWDLWKAKADQMLTRCWDPLNRLLKKRSQVFYNTRMFYIQKIQ